MDADALIAWYRREGRSLPWRASRRAGRVVPPDPWAVFVSEAMLQQTQVATVLPYFDRFLRQFPEPADLAAAAESDVLKAWEGLGYYRRARNLQAAARAMVEMHGGRVPADLDALLALPGVGRYTAGAVLSNAFDRRAPIVDGNVARVLARHHGITEPVDGTAGSRQLWQHADELAQAASSPRDINQALMELGALICTPRGPRCLFCPVADTCRAHRDGDPESLPRKKAKKPPVAVDHHTLILCRSDRVLLRERPARGLWAGLWEFPTEEAGAAPDAAAIKSAFGLEAESGAAMPAFVHPTTHRTITFRPRIWHVTGGRLRARTGSWSSLRDAGDRPLARPQSRILAWLTDVHATHP